MYIQEAAKQAVEINGVISRETNEKDYTELFHPIKPTDSYGACLIIEVKDGKAVRMGERWNPTVEDLLADDWEVLKNTYSK